MRGHHLQIPLRGWTSAWRQSLDIAEKGRFILSYKKDTTETSNGGEATAPLSG